MISRKHPVSQLWRLCSSLKFELQDCPDWSVNQINPTCPENWLDREYHGKQSDSCPDPLQAEIDRELFLSGST
jgi:hypothetical protein